MAFERLTIKKVYYYIVCVITLLVLMWGTVDIISSVLSLTLFKPPSLGLDVPSGPQGGGSESQGASGPSFDEYYQSRMSLDKIGDSIARILVAGAIFAYSGMRIRELEGKEI